MELDMHFYGTYALARSAGIPPKEARIIAHSAQFVDDSITEDNFELEGGKYYLPIMTAHKVFDIDNVLPEGNDHWRVWVCFHFLPGAEGDSPEERLICRKGDQNGKPAQQMLDYSLAQKNKPYGMHLAGVVSHVFEDTFSHFGFIGISSSLNLVDQGSIKEHIEDLGILDYVTGKATSYWNKFKGSCAEVAKLGHAAATNYPDRPYLHWDYEYEVGGRPRVTRNNTDDFLEACRRLHDFYVKLGNQNMNIQYPTPAKTFEEIEETVGRILATEARMGGRVAAWKEAIQAGWLFQPVPADTQLNYREEAWRVENVEEHFRAGRPEVNCHAKWFMQAARMHRNHMLAEILPQHGLIL